MHTDKISKAIAFPNSNNTSIHIKSKKTVNIKIDAKPQTVMKKNLHNFLTKRLEKNSLNALHLIIKNTGPTPSHSVDALHNSL